MSHRPFSVFGSPSYALKRVFDVVVSALVVIIALPLWAAVAVAIKLDSSGPVFHRARRIGKDGRPFTLYKFRTMVEGADAQGPRITRRDDPRITRVGRFLRRMKIDEMPQLLNVLKGEMSIVGPRPEDPRYVAHYTPEQRRVFAVRPGMASPAFIKYRHEEELLAALGGDLEEAYLQHILPDKLQMDLDYIARQSFGYDLAILAQAALSLFTRPDGRLPRDLVSTERTWDEDAQSTTL
ncbi:MAG: sugar transferase [Anaerolineae bacterium]